MNEIHPNLPLLVTLLAGMFVGGIAGFVSASLWLAGESERIKKATWRAAMRYYRKKYEEAGHV
jgi:gas vesicle protein